jgi:ribonuclease P protein component
LLAGWQRRSSKRRPAQAWPRQPEVQITGIMAHTEMALDLTGDTTEPKADHRMAPRTGFARPFRLVNTQDFQRVFSKTECKSSDACLVMLAVHNDCGRPRLGMAMSKRKIKNAVARNRLKRLVRESFRRHQHELQNLDIVVLGNSRAATVTNQQLFACLDMHWKKLATRCKKSSSV